MVELQFPRWIGVVCDDVDRQRAFYRDVLGLRESGGGDDRVQFDLGPDVGFELLRRSTDPECDAPRYQVGFVVEDLRAARQELLARGVEAVTDVMEASDGTARWAYFRDPEGNVFEITQRRAMDRRPRHDLRMEFRLAVSVPPDRHPFELWVEPEGMMYDLPATETVVLTFRGTDAMTVELAHRRNAVIIWRPSDTEVWATTPDGACTHIAGWPDLPFPGLDSGGEPLDAPVRALVETLFHDANPPTIDGMRVGPADRDPGTASAP